MNYHEILVDDEKFISLGPWMWIRRNHGVVEEWQCPPRPPGKKKKRKRTEDEERGAMSLSIFYCLAFNMNGEKEILVWQLGVFCFNYIFLKEYLS